MEESPQYSADYLDPEKRSIANAVQVFFDDGTSTDEVEVEYPIGHRRRRPEALPLLYEKLRSNISGRFPPDRIESIVRLFQDRPRLERLTTPELVQLFI